MRQRMKGVSLAVLVALLGAVATLGGCASLGVPAHFASHQLCSAVFVSGLDASTYYAEAVLPKLGVAGKLLSYEIDRSRHEVRTSLAGVVRSRAVESEQYGCRVVHDEAPTAQRDVPATKPSPTAEGEHATVPLTRTNDAFTAVLDSAFEEPESGPHRFTKAIVVMHRGTVVAERYARGVTPSTPLQGWSMTKSLTNALLGVLVRDGRLKMNDPAPIPEWSSSTDAHQAITSDHLLRMVSGLKCGDSLHTAGWKTIFDDDTQMEYDVADEASHAARAKLHTAPGTQWQYTNCNFVLLSRIVRDSVGASREATQQFIARELFAPLGFEHATLEYDSAGTPLGTIQLWASARDWARLGQLYLNDGLSPDGHRLLPEGWVEYSAQLTPQSDVIGYGAGFWTQRGSSTGGRERVAAGMPKDSFMAVGSQGQYTIIIPSEELVIVRLGWSYTPHDDLEATERLTRETIAALHRTTTQ